MGLAIVDVIIQIEENFGIDFPEDKVFYMTTVGGLHKLVLDELCAYTPKTCPTSTAFYRFRRELCNALGFEREQIRPATVLNDLFPDIERQQMWNCVESVSELPLPKLYVNRYAESAYISFAIAWGFTLLHAKMMEYSLLWPVFFGLFGIVLIHGALSRIDPSRFEKSYITVGDIARQVAIDLPDDRFEREQASYEEIRKIISEVGGVALDEIKPESNLFRELDLG